MSHPKLRLFQSVGSAMVAISVAILYYSVLRVAYPQGGFIRDMLAIIGVALVGGIFALAFEKPVRPSYYVTLAWAIAFFFTSAFALKCGLKNLLAEIFSTNGQAINKLISPEPGSPLKKLYSTEEYWRNY